MCDKQMASNSPEDVTVEVQCGQCGQWIPSAYVWIYPSGHLKCIICAGKRINLLHVHGQLIRRGAHT